VYVAFVVDAFFRRIVGWKASRTMTTSLVLDALNLAARVRRGIDVEGPLICHSDAGSQYTPEQIVRKLREGDRMLNEGKDITEVVRHVGIAESTWNRWRSQYAGHEGR